LLKPPFSLQPGCVNTTEQDMKKMCRTNTVKTPKVNSFEVMKICICYLILVDRLATMSLVDVSALASQKLTWGFYKIAWKRRYAYFLSLLFTIFNAILIFCRLKGYENA
jgi:hypothetical protein